MSEFATQLGVRAERNREIDSSPIGIVHLSVVRKRVDKLAGRKDLSIPVYRALLFSLLVDTFGADISFDIQCGSDTRTSCCPSRAREMHPTREKSQVEKQQMLSQNIGSMGGTQEFESTKRPERLGSALTSTMLLVDLIIIAKMIASTDELRRVRICKLSCHRWWVAKTGESDVYRRRRRFEPLPGIAQTEDEPKFAHDEPTSSDNRLCQRGDTVILTKAARDKYTRNSRPALRICCRKSNCCSAVCIESACVESVFCKKFCRKCCYFQEPNARRLLKTGQGHVVDTMWLLKWNGYTLYCRVRFGHHEYWYLEEELTTLKPYDRPRTDLGALGHLDTSCLLRRLANDKKFRDAVLQQLPQKSEKSHSWKKLWAVHKPSKECFEAASAHVQRVSVQATISSMGILLAEKYGLHVDDAIKFVLDAELYHLHPSAPLWFELMRCASPWAEESVKKPGRTALMHRLKAQGTSCLRTSARSTPSICLPFYYILTYFLGIVFFILTTPRTLLCYVCSQRPVAPADEESPKPKQDVVHVDFPNQSSQLLRTFCPCLMNSYLSSEQQKLQEGDHVSLTPVAARRKRLSRSTVSMVNGGRVMKVYQENAFRFCAVCQVGTPSCAVNVGTGLCREHGDETRIFPEYDLIRVLDPKRYGRPRLRLRSSQCNCIQFTTAGAKACRSWVFLLSILFGILLPTFLGDLAACTASVVGGYGAENCTNFGEYVDIEYADSENADFVSNSTNRRLLGASDSDHATDNTTEKPRCQAGERLVSETRQSVVRTTHAFTSFAHGFTFIVALTGAETMTPGDP
eukprot:SAG11_NODE_352_length_10364_cov_17.751388_5_plen_801_part_01